MDRNICAIVVGIVIPKDIKNRTIGRLRFLDIDADEKIARLDEVFPQRSWLRAEAGATMYALPFAPTDVIQLIEPDFQADHGTGAFSEAVRAAVTSLNLLSDTCVTEEIKGQKITYPTSAALLLVAVRDERANGRWIRAPLLIDAPPLEVNRRRSHVAYPILASMNMLKSASGYSNILATHSKELRVGARRLERVFAQCSEREDAFIDVFVALECLFGKLSSPYGLRMGKLLRQLLGPHVEPPIVKELYETRNAIVHGDIKAQLEKLNSWYQHHPNNSGSSRQVDWNPLVWDSLMFDLLIDVLDLAKAAYLHFLNDDPQSIQPWRKKLKQNVASLEKQARTQAFTPGI